MSGSLILSWGKYGGFYWFNKYSKRLCLGFVSFTYLPDDIDTIL